MNMMIHKPAEHEAQLMQANREELVERIGWVMREDGTTQPLPGLHLYRRSSPRQLLHGVSEPSVAVIAQGSKEVLLGENRYQYGHTWVSTDTSSRGFFTSSPRYCQRPPAAGLA